VSLLQSPRRPSSSAFALGSTDVFGAVDDSRDVPTSRAFDPSRPFSAAGLEDDGPRVGLDRELDLSTERPHADGKVGRGSLLLVAGIVSSSIVLGVIIMLARGDVGQGLAAEPAAPPAITEVVSAPAEPAQVEPAPAVVAPPTPPTAVATQRVPNPVASPVKAEPARAEITPAAIAPASTAPTAPSTTEPPVEPAGALAPGFQLPPPVFAEPEPTKPEPTPPAAAEPGDDASAPLPGIEEPAPAEPREEPGATAPEAAQPSHAGASEPAERETFDHLPGRTVRPAS
jgi:hypothetical protein